ncbi:DUF4040 domain-containing protein [Macrococcus hajekii]|uniref:DUF4040 domain-containing protein n=1 Tax=Macrococcus hajekii TaxID=198482 RepID=A0A4R6BMZ2_9STAP|nr:hydrogen gas-evolving membrane-bound hydrogenase subunit E [Macrococcus hajekii]TDM03210.1 DUF4040 domain-containing protein [Macrococcus hajekii]GGA96902.1 Na+/H+ antiporter subunit A [Macrococcus hajekii]
MLALFILTGFLIMGCVWLHHRIDKRIPLGVTVLLYPLLGTILSVYAIVTKQIFNQQINWIPALGVNFSFRLDSLSLIFFTLISFIGVLVVLYSIFYLSTHENLPKFYSFLLLFMIAMYGVVLSTNTIILYVFWELTSISSFLLISFWYKKKAAQQGALKSFLITVFGGMMMLLGFIALYVLTGSNDITQIAALLKGRDQSTLYYFAMGAIMLGALTKSAQFPFHIWLPDAMEAPTPVSAYLHSATMVKAGIYLLLRFMPVFSGEPVFQWVLIIDGLMTMLIGSLFAVRQSDLKGLLAYSTISQLGMIVSMIGLAAFESNDVTFRALIVLALTAALLHIINHGLFKAALFMGAGIVDHAAHTRDLNKLGGLRKAMPITFTVMTIAALSMAGIPFLNGFLSKEMFLTVLVDLRGLDVKIVWLLVAVGVIASIGTFVYSLIAIIRTFLGEQTIEIEEGESKGILLSPVILAFLVVLLFFIPNFLLFSLIEPALHQVLDFDPTDYVTPIHAWHGFNLPLYLTILIIVLGTLIVWSGVYKKLFPKYKEMPLNRIYKYTLRSVDVISHNLIRRIMTDRLNHYLMFLFGVIIVATLPISLTVMLSVYPAFEMSDISFYMLILTAFIVIASLVLLKVQSRMTATVLVGAIGYGTSMVYILMYAPDLALTQFVIETITTVLFLSCFYHLPNLEKENKSRINRIVSLIIALSMTLLVVSMMIISQSTELFDSITEYYKKAYDLTGGKNIVNAILGDFRAFDTMLEGVVLMITGLGIYSLIRRKVGAKHERK